MSQSVLHEPPSIPSPTNQPFAEYRFDCSDLVDDFDVVTFEATEALNQPYRVVLRLRALHGEADAGQLLGRDVRVSITAHGSTRRFSGIVDRVTVGRDVHHDVDVCTATIVPALSSLRRTVDSRIFQDQTALEIVAQVLTETLSGYGRRTQIDAVDAARLVKRDYCVQYRETTLDFVHRLLEEEGIGYYFIHEDGPETLFLFDDNRSLAAHAEPIEFGNRTGADLATDRLFGFPPTLERTSTALTTRDYDWRLAGRGQLESQGQTNGAAARPHEVYEHGVDRHHVIHEDTTMLLAMVQTVVTSIIGASLPAPVADRVFDLTGSLFDAFSASNTEDRGRVGRERLGRDAETFDGVSYVIGLAAGSAFRLMGHPRRGVDDEYYVTRIRHSSEPPTDDETRALAGNGLPDNYFNRVECLRRSRPWRPLRTTPKPRIEGVQVATVSGPPGLEVYTDPYGRIRVRFPWDRSPDSLSGHHTCWLRVSQTWAGSTAPATLFIPRVGMEVLVSFIDGDPDRPVVTGCVYNGDNPSPALLPFQATKSIIRTRSIPGGLGYNELSFEDAVGMERVYLRAERDLSELVQNNHEVHVGHNETSFVAGTRAERIGFDHHHSVGRHLEQSVSGHWKMSAGGNHTRSVVGSAVDRFGQNYTVDVSGAMSTAVPEGGWDLYAGRSVTITQGAIGALRIGDEETGYDPPLKRGMTLESEGSAAHLTKDNIEIGVGQAKLVMSPDKVEITVGGSKLVINPTTILANGKTIPAS